MSHRVLIVDDDRQIANLTNTWMSACGYKTAVAHDGESGLELARRDPPDLVLLDIRMPGIDGFEVFARMKRTPELGRTRVVFLSANVHEDARKQAADAGASGFLAKPYEPQELVGTVRRVLEQSAA